MIPESLDWPLNLFLTGTVVLAVGCLTAGVGVALRSWNVERERDQRYVRRKRGEEPLPIDPPGIARALEYLGGAIAFIGIVVLVAAWTLTPGQS